MYVAMTNLKGLYEKELFSLLLGLMFNNNGRGKALPPLLLLYVPHASRKTHTWVYSN